jgi:hypothetical protein
MYRTCVGVCDGAIVFIPIHDNAHGFHMCWLPRVSRPIKQMCMWTPLPLVLIHRRNFKNKNKNNRFSFFHSLPTFKIANSNSQQGLVQNILYSGLNKITHTINDIDDFLTQCL